MATVARVARATSARVFIPGSSRMTSTAPSALTRAITRTVAPVSIDEVRVLNP